jgi:hypothetical protein
LLSRGKTEGLRQAVPRNRPVREGLSEWNELLPGLFSLDPDLSVSYKIFYVNVLLIEVNPFAPVSTPISLGAGERRENLEKLKGEP